MNFSVSSNGTVSGSVNGSSSNTPSNSVTPSGSGNGPVLNSNGFHSPSAQQIVGSNGLPIPTSLLKLQTAAQPVIESVVFVIIKKDGTRLQLSEKSSISLREMIGMCKFITLASLHGPSNIQWSALIKSLNIEKHFDSIALGQTYDSKQLVINLHDAT